MSIHCGDLNDALLARLQERMGADIDRPFAEATVKRCGARFVETKSENDRAFLQFCFFGWFNRQLSETCPERSDHQWKALQSRAVLLLEESTSNNGILAWETMSGVRADDLWKLADHMGRKPVPPLAERPALRSGTRPELVPMDTFVNRVVSWLEHWGLASSADGTTGTLTLTNGGVVRWYLDDAVERSSTRLETSGPVMRIANKSQLPGGTMRSFLHELGHALFLAFVCAATPLEFRAYGDPSVHEGFAFLIERLLTSREWWSSLGPDLIGPDGAFDGFRRGMVLTTNDESRGVIAELAFWGYSPATHHPDIASCGLWKALGRLALTFQWSDYLRGLEFASTIDYLLGDRFGAAWFLKLEARDALQSLWSAGTSRRAEEHVKDLRSIISASPRTG